MARELVEDSWHPARKGIREKPVGNSKSPAKLGKCWQRDFTRCPNVELISGLVRAAFCGWPGCGLGGRGRARGILDRRSWPRKDRITLPVTSGPVTPQWLLPSWPELVISSPTTARLPGSREADGNSSSCPLWEESARRNVCADGLKPPRHPQRYSPPLPDPRGRSSCRTREGAGAGSGQRDAAKHCGKRYRQRPLQAHRGRLEVR